MIMKSRRAAFALASAALLAVPAAAANDGITEKVKVVSSPSGALAIAGTGNSCSTPCTLRLPIRDGGKIHITLEGYEPQSVTIGSHVDGALIAQDVINSATDPFAAIVNGLALAIWGPKQFKSLDAGKIRVDLVPVGTAPAVRGADALAAAAADSDPRVEPDVSDKPVYGPTLRAISPAAARK